MKNFRLSIIALLILVILPSAKTDKPTAASLAADDSFTNQEFGPGWYPADFCGYINGEKTFDVSYYKSVKLIEGAVRIQVLNRYTPCGRLHYQELGLPSPYVRASSTAYLFDFSDNTFCVEGCFLWMDDGTSLSHVFTDQELVWHKVEAGKISAKYAKLARELAGY